MLASIEARFGTLTFAHREAEALDHFAEGFQRFPGGKRQTGGWIEEDAFARVEKTFSAVDELKADQRIRRIFWKSTSSDDP